ncbi:MAG: OmpA family protein [Flavobacteriales bacterium]|nr:OmpA family protein [Flavobacteriales bacterium]
MKGLIIAVVICAFGGFNLHAQNVEFKAANFKDKKDAFNAIIEKMKVAEPILEAANEDIANVRDPHNKFKDVLATYIEAQAFNPNNAEVNMNLGNIYLYTNEKYKAKPYLDKAKELSKDVDPMLYFYLGQAEQLTYSFSGAIKYYKLFEENAKNKLAEQYRKISGKYKKECKFGKEFKANPERVWVDNMKAVNSEGDDFSPCISADGELLMFTSSRENGHPKNKYDEYDGDIYFSSLNGRKFGAAKNAGTPLSTPKDETASSLAYDGQRLLMFKEDNGNMDIYESTLEGVLWGEPVKKLSKIPNTEFNETYATYEPQDIKVFYIFDGMSRGDKEIFVSGLMVYTKSEYNKWGKGQSIGQPVTTRYNEGSVFVHPDGNTMYFSSQGHNSMGGYDIFMTTRNDLEQWTKPINMGYPINTPYDDLFYASTANGKHAYIASNRDGGVGKLDLYQVTFWGPDKKMAIGSEDFLLAGIAEPIQDVQIEAAVEVDKKSLTVFKGKVIDNITRQPVGADIVIVDNVSGKVFSEFKSNSATGKFLLSLPAGKNYGISVNKDGYLFHSENFDIPKASDFNMVNKDVELKNIAVGSKIALRNVFFQSGKSIINPTSYTELGRLVSLLNDVPSLVIELGGHTDNVGSEAANMKLSGDRASVVVDYLKKEGISASRLQSKGYGPTQPIDSNGTNEGRQNNRRTEFMIIAN